MANAVIYIHGVVGRTTGDHRRDYAAMARNLRRSEVPMPDVEDSVGVEWGWPTPLAPATGDLALAQERLNVALAQSPVGDRLTGFLVKPLRRLMQYGWADMVYYTSPQGEHAARSDVWSQIMARIPVDAPVDLTIISHSLGSMLAHDFLFYLYSGQRRERRSRVCATEAEWDAAERNWRLRRLVTMGSPLGPLMVRTPNFIDRITSSSAPWFDPADIGLGQPSHLGARPVWLNVWDRHDIVSFPVSGIYGAGDRIRDLYPDVSNWPPRAHGRYWRSKKVAQALARFWES